MCLKTKKAKLYLFEAFILFAACLFFAPAAAAELQATVNVSKKRINLDDTVTLTVTLKGSGVERIRMPDPFPPSFTLVDKSDKPSLSQDAYGRPISGRVIRYQLKPTVPGRFRLGDFSISQVGSMQKITGEAVEVIGQIPNQQTKRQSSGKPPSGTPATGSQDAGTTEQIEAAGEPTGPIDVRLTAEVDRARVFVGDRITLSIRITHNSFEVDDIKLIDLPQFAGFWNKEILLTRHVNPPREIRINGRQYVTQLIPRFILYPATSGKLTIPPLTYGMLAHTRAGRGSAPVRSLVLKTSPISVEAIPLPETNRPAEFRGAVGKYKLNVELLDRVTRVGSPAKLVIEVETDGNLDAITPPLLPSLQGAKVYELNRVQVKDKDKDGQAQPLARWEAEIVPTAAGRLSIPPISFAYFDPSSQNYRIEKSGPLSLEVAAAESVQQGDPSQSPAGFISRLYLSRKVRYSLLAILLIAGLGVAFIIARRQKASPAPVAAPQTTETSPVVEEIRKLVNSSYGKLHRGDERAYCGDILRALRLVFESGFGVPPSELTVEKIDELLRRAGASEALYKGAVGLYEECERICFSPGQGGSRRGTNYARFDEARGLIFNLLEFIP